MREKNIFKNKKYHKNYALQFQVYLIFLNLKLEKVCSPSSR